MYTATQSWYVRSYTAQCSEDQTSAAQGSIRHGKLKYNSSSGKIGEFEKEMAKFQGKIREFDKG